MGASCLRLQLQLFGDLVTFWCLQQFLLLEKILLLSRYKKNNKLALSVVDSQGRNTWADIINRANWGMEVMHERNAHNFPLDLAAVEALNA